MLSELTECTVLMLKVIHKMYSTQRITYEEFVNHTAKKLQFLSDNIHVFTDETEKRDVYEIICKCNSVMSGGSSSCLQ